MVEKVEDHGRQINRIRRDIRDIADDALSLGKLQILNWVMIGLELLAAGFGGWHLWHETYLIAAQAFIIEIALIAIHAVGMSIEKRIHRTHDSRLAEGGYRSAQAQAEQAS